MVGDVIEESAYCTNQTCHIKKIYGDGLTDDFDGECTFGDKAITKDIHGKEAIEFAKFMKDQLTTKEE